MPYMIYMVIDKQIKRTYTWLKQRERELKRTKRRNKC